MLSRKNRGVLLETFNTEPFISLETSTVFFASTLLIRNKYKFSFNTLLSICIFIAVFWTTSSSNYRGCD